MDPRHRRALEAILEHCATIEAYVVAVGPGWQGDEMAVDAIAKRLEEVGRARGRSPRPGAGRSASPGRRRHDERMTA